MNHVRETVIRHNAGEVENVEINLLQVFDCLFKMVNSNLKEVSQGQKLDINIEF